MSIWEKLPAPFFVLAPMDDVTDTVFRQLIGSLAAPDLYFTEFVSVDGLQSVGRRNLLKRIQFTANERPIIAQIWGKNPDNYYKTAGELVELGFDGIDINMGCPVKAVVKNGCCSALIENRDLAVEIIKATQAGSDGRLPVSVKTRLGFSKIDLSWHALLLEQKLDALSVHGRTSKQLSDVPADWHKLGEISKLRDQLSPTTKIVGNGDVMNRQQGIELATEHGIDGIMIGRGVFADPFVFATDSPWPTYTRQQRIQLFAQHVKLFSETWKNKERNIHTLNKFCKMYIQSFDGAKELREKLMSAKKTQELLRYLTE